MRTLIIAAALLASAPAFAADKDVAEGKRLYDHVGCYQCHGYVAQGGAAVRLAPEPMPYEALSQFVRSTTGAMPRYTEKILSESDLRKIYAYLQSIPQPVSVAKTPLLLNAAGK